jgi:hypothetical protein
MGRLVCRGPPQHHHLGRQVRQLGHRHGSRAGKYDIYVLQATIEAEAVSGSTSPRYGEGENPTVTSKRLQLECGGMVVRQSNPDDHRASRIRLSHFAEDLGRNLDEARD